MKHKFDKKGITLIELMVALVICGIIIAAIYRLFVAQTRAYSTQEQVADIQQNVRNAMELLIQDIRNAGCDDDKTQTKYPDPPITPGADSITIQYEYTDTSVYPRVGMIRTINYYVDGNNRLMRNQLPPSTPPAEAGGDPILENVGTFVLTYGVDSSPAGILFNDRRLRQFVPVGAIGGANIVAVRVQLSGATPPNLPDLGNVSPRALDTVIAMRNLMK
jgi:prepilin-type N-terminal cleavage/methylation domain-containing protein